MSVKQQLFTEKFRPKDLNQLIALPRIKKELSKGVVQNLLLYAKQGVGKTSTSLILAKQYPYLLINTSAERGIDMVRDKINKFCSSMSLEGGKEQIKIVILEEFDSGTTEMYSALRNVIERYANNVRFIATCNFLNKIPEPIQSRFNCINFEPINQEEEEFLLEEYKKRVGAVLKAANITYTIETLEKFIKNDFPDLRTLYNKIQSFYLQEIKELNEKNFNTNFDFLDLFNLLINPNSKPWDNYKLIVSEYSNKSDEVLYALGNDFPYFIKDNCPNKIDKLPLVMIALNDFIYQKNFVIDNNVLLSACFFKLQSILNN